MYVLDEHGSQTKTTEIKSFFKMKAAAIYISNNEIFAISSLSLCKHMLRMSTIHYLGT